MRQINGLHKTTPPEVPGLHLFRDSAKMLSGKQTNPSPGLSGGRSPSPAPPAFFVLENAGGLPPVVAPARPPLKRRRSGSCSVPARFPSGSFSYNAGRKTVPPLLIARRCPRSPPPLRFRFVRPAGFRWSVSRFRFRLPGSGTGNPAPLFRKPLQIPFRFLGLLSSRKLAPALCPCGRCPAALSPAAFFFAGSRLPTCSPTGRTLCRRVGHGPTRKKKKPGRRLVRFFCPPTLDNSKTPSIIEIVAGTHKTDSFCRA